MGECFISRRGGNSYKKPTLDDRYPEDVTVFADAHGSASFSISIVEHGKPEEYSYQWYVNGQAVIGAINSNYTMITTADKIGTYTIYCEVKNKAGIINSRAATLIVKSVIPTIGTGGTMSYDGGNGSYKLVAENDYHWTLYLYSSGLLTFHEDYAVDIFLQAGGGGGGPGGDADFTNGGGGGAGGKQKTLYAQTVNGSYPITIGSGGAAESRGGTTSAFNQSATGGAGSTGQSGATDGTGAGGNGGGYFGNGVGSSGGDGGQGKQAFGAGDTYYGAGGGGTAGTFGERSGYGGETGGGNGGGNGHATKNTGSGGGGDGGKGGSGIVIIRSAR